MHDPQQFATMSTVAGRTDRILEVALDVFAIGVPASVWSIFFRDVLVDYNRRLCGLARLKVAGSAALYAWQLCHFDFKIDNTINAGRFFKVADFGLAVETEQGPADASRQPRRVWGRKTCSRGSHWNC